VVVAAQSVGSGFGRAVQHRDVDGARGTALGGDLREHAARGDGVGERGQPAELPHHVLLHLGGDERGVLGVDQRGEVRCGDRRL
jgi:hypothetical protein